MLSSPFTAVLLALACVAGYVGFHHAFVAVRGRARSLHLSFATLSLLVALYDLFRIWRLGAQHTEALQLATKVLWTFELAQVGCLFTFVMLFTGCHGRRLQRMVRAALGVFLAVNWVRSSGLAMMGVRGVQPRTLAWGETIWVLDRAPAMTVFYWAFLALLAALFVWMFRCCLVQARTGAKARALAMGSALLMLIAGISYNVAIDMQASRFPHFVELSYLGLVVVMSLVLSGDVSRAAALSEALVKSEDELRIVLDSIGDAVVATDAEGRLRGANPAAERLFGWRAREVRGQPLAQLWQTSEARRLLEPRAAAGAQEAVVTVRSPQGEERQVTTGCAPLADAAGRRRGTVYLFRDVSLLMQLEARLRQSQKMEAVGQLAAGVAHDFNNLLTAIVGHAELLAFRLTRDPESRELLAGIVTAADRAAGVTRQLMSLSRKTPAARQRLDLHLMVNQLVPMLREVLDPRITIRLQLESTDHHTDSDPDLIHAALLNLALNARDAMPDGGTLTFETALVTSRNAGLDPSSARRYVRLGVHDTGTGIPPQHLDKVFEPFFTTKEPGKGTGLGLAAVYGIMRASDGAVRARTRPEGGAALELFFPVVARAATDRRAADDAAPARAGRILVVDDDEAVGRAVGRLLERTGHLVTLAFSGTAALEQVRDLKFDVALVDWMMPGLHGAPLIAALRQHLPELKVVVMSGHTGNETQMPDGVAFLAKPFSASHLNSTIAGFLPAPRHAAVSS